MVGSIVSTPPPKYHNFNELQPSLAGTDAGSNTGRANFFSFTVSAVIPPLDQYSAL